MQALDKLEVDRIIDNNLEDEFDKLGATPGFVLVPMPFEKVHICLSCVAISPITDRQRGPWLLAQVQELAQQGTLESLGRLGRHPQHIRTYRQFRQRVCND